MSKLIASILLGVCVIIVFAAEVPLVFGQDKIATGIVRCDEAEVGSWVDNYVSGQTHASTEPVIAIGIVMDGRLCLQKGYGRIDGRTDRPVTSGTILRAASVTKLVTATAVMQQVERGNLDLDRNVNDYLKQFRLDENYPTHVTLRHLITHTSGIEDRIFGGSRPVTDFRISLAEYFEKNVPERVRPPGQQIVYSNTGMALAGHLVEIASGLGFEEYVEKNIFQPLGMERSSLRQPYPEALAPDVVPSGGDSTALMLFPAGSMISSASDMSRFLAAHLNGGQFEGKRILSKPSVDEMHRKQFAGHSEMPGVALGFFETLNNGRRLLYHTGQSGHQALLVMSPDEGFGLYVVLSVSQGGVYQDFRRNFLDSFMDRFYPSPADSAVTPPPIGQDLDKFAGLYRANLFPVSTIGKVGGLAADTRVRAIGDDALEIVLPLSSMTFRARQIAPGLFKSDDGFFFAFDQTGDAKAARMHMSGSIVDPMGFDRLNWYQSGTLHLIVFCVGFLVFLIYASPGIMWSGYRFITRRKRPAISSDRFANVAYIASMVVSLHVILSPVVALVLYFSMDPELRPYRIDAILYVSLGLLHIAAFIGIFLPIAAFQLWRRGYWSPTRRTMYTVIAIAGVMLLPLMYHWNLLGFKF